MNSCIRNSYFTVILPGAKAYAPLPTRFSPQHRIILNALVDGLNVSLLTTLSAWCSIPPSRCGRSPSVVTWNDAWSCSGSEFDAVHWYSSGRPTRWYLLLSAYDNYSFSCTHFCCSPGVSWIESPETASLYDQDGVHAYLHHSLLALLHYAEPSSLLSVWSTLMPPSS